MHLISKLREAFSDTRVIAAGHAAGLKFSARRADPNFARGSYERPLQDAIAANLAAGDVFYDIGANIGFFSLLAARRVTAQGSVYAFEPVPNNAAMIVRNAALNGFASIEVFNEAVGARTGRAELNLAHHIGGAVLASAGTPPDMRGRMQVDVVALDDVIARRKLRPPALVKIDVEGAELDVLSGMRQTLSAHRPKVVYEIDDVSRAGVARKAADISAFLAGWGYVLTALPAAYANDTWQVAHVLARPGAH